MPPRVRRSTKVAALAVGAAAAVKGFSDLKCSYTAAFISGAPGVGAPSPERASRGLTAADNVPSSNYSGYSTMGCSALALAATGLVAVRAKSHRRVGKAPTARAAAEVLEARLQRERELMAELERKATAVKQKMSTELADERKFSEELKQQIASLQNLYCQLSDDFEMCEIQGDYASSDATSVQKDLAAKNEAIRKLEADTAKKLQEFQEALRTKTQTEEDLVAKANKLTLQMMEAKKAGLISDTDPEESSTAQWQREAEAAEAELEKEREKAKAREAEEESVRKMEAELAAAKGELKASYDKATALFQRRKQMEDNIKKVAEIADVHDELKRQIQATMDKEQGMLAAVKLSENEAAAAKGSEAKAQELLEEVQQESEALKRRIPMLEAESKDLLQRILAMEASELKEANLNEELAQRLGALKERVTSREGDAKQAVIDTTPWTNSLMQAVTDWLDQFTSNFQ